MWRCTSPPSSVILIPPGRVGLAVEHRAEVGVLERRAEDELCVEVLLVAATIGRNETTMSACACWGRMNASESGSRRSSSESTWSVV